LDEMFELCGCRFLGRDVLKETTTVLLVRFG
jgi:hypothetical protein